MTRRLYKLDVVVALILRLAPLLSTGTARSGHGARDVRRGLSPAFHKYGDATEGAEAPLGKARRPRISGNI
jgi:hypothetical protein